MNMYWQHRVGRDKRNEKDGRLEGHVREREDRVPDFSTVVHQGRLVMARCGSPRKVYTITDEGGGGEGGGGGGGGGGEGGGGAGGGSGGGGGGHEEACFVNSFLGMG